MTLKGKPEAAHDAIIGLIGNTFGSGDEAAFDILSTLECNGFAVIRLPESEPIPEEYNDEGLAGVQCLGRWIVDDDEINAWSDGLISQGDGTEWTPGYISDFAAALLAAAACYNDSINDNGRNEQ